MAGYTYLLIAVFLISDLQPITSTFFNDGFEIDILGLNTLARQEKCVTTLPDQTQEEGICKTRTECLLTGGVPRGRCGLLSTCCAYSKGCGRTSNLKVSYFSSGLNSALPELCTFNVLRANENVCQVRLDFLAFQSNPPTLVVTPTVSELQCADDNFFVSFYNGLPQICGHNTGQHIYLHVSQNVNNISLNMKMSKSAGAARYWNIKITQLECPKKDSILNKVDKELVNDYNNLAPVRCLQYFTARSGILRNFGYDATKTDTAYVSNQKYAICFRRTDDVCGVSFIAKNHDFGAGTACDDYLEVPGLDNPLFTNGKICNIGSDVSFSSLSPGPLHIDFYAKSNQIKKGFDMTYEMKSCSF